ncbi:hypothetical protein GCM10007898_40050 [Dyella flagellata]|uniref:Uncharacterized protein n=1 Tax=Dyella flagellata TaxID=1867833 RepID=A0ABQ5XGV9_9GAMM|nr:hypothetical protein GCM10007898_40050 [Dyella flagellata]
MPGLGSVLYLQAVSNTAMPTALPPGLLVMQHSFAPLLDVHWLVAISAVTDDGPREWCDCVDSLGRTLARWHLLPDTDYLAWDALAASCKANADAVFHTQPLRPQYARVMNFRLREFAGLLLLERGASVALSPLGERIAGRIAQAESAVLQP